MIKFVNKKTRINTTAIDCMTESLNFIRDGLADAGVNSKLAIKAELLSDEMIAAMLSHSDGSTMDIQVRKYLGDTVINIKMKGEEFELYADEPERIEDAEDEIREEVIRGFLLRAYGENLKYSHKKGINRVTIKAEEAHRSMMKSTLIALAFALVLGMLMKTAMPETTAVWIGDYILTPFRTMFMSALKMVIGPVVFFSIVTCLSQFKDISELGKIGMKVLSTYMFTTVMAVVIATSVFFAIKPGQVGAALTGQMESQAVDIATDVDTSLLNTIVNIVPSNFVKPFLENDTLQIIFLALICGIAVGMIGDYSKVLKEWFEACNSLFLTVTTIVARFIPLAVFCSVSLMIYQMGGKSMLSLLGVFVTHGIAIALMLVLYGLLVLVVGRLSPLKFFSKARESMVTSLMLMSSSAAMPTNMKTCTEKLGISPKVANFSIPLGATINMDGTCIFLTIFGLYLARLYGMDVNVSTVLSMAITIILLSLGAPGVPGSGLVCLGIVVTQLGVPIESLGLVMAINPFVDMLDTMSNVTGDIAAATVTAKSEGLLDTDVFNS
ncbi:MAG: dicarboxylate/amino acid:cation symporter [Mogibacterium sp.]|nr:dicarboxylate/amino acid:cation symporter [Mogibacterium sp.]